MKTIRQVNINNRQNNFFNDMTKFWSKFKYSPSII